MPENIEVGERFVFTEISLLIRCLNFRFMATDRLIKQMRSSMVENPHRQKVGRKMGSVNVSEFTCFQSQPFQRKKSEKRRKRKTKVCPFDLRSKGFSWLENFYSNQIRVRMIATGYSFLQKLDSNWYYSDIVFSNQNQDYSFSFFPNYIRI